jgi:hypothetical protein
MRSKTRISVLFTAALAAVLASSFLAHHALASSPGYIVNNYVSPSGTGALCLDAQDDNVGHSPFNNGDPVQLWTCTKFFNQTWTAPDPGVWGTITAASGLCLDAVKSGATSNGDSVQLWTCNGGLQQQWKGIEVVGNTYYIENGYGLYLDAQLDATHSPAKNGDRVQLYSFNGEAQQIWS